MQTINRVINVFPPHQQSQIRAQLSFVLEGVVCQSLLPRASGTGRVAALEIMIPNSAIRNLIREDKMHQIYSQMQIGQGVSGMRTLNQHLSQLHAAGTITLEEAIGSSSDPNELQQIMSSSAAAGAGAGPGTSGSGAPPGSRRESR